MPSLRDPLLIFSDLDGTLLDIHTYDWRPALPWLTKLQDAQIPLIVCSSKTAAETRVIQRDLGLHGLPFIAENGAVLQPDLRWGASRQILGLPHQTIRDAVNRLRLLAGYKFTSVDDVDDRVVSDWTGLPRDRAALACRHEASVTLIWRDSDAKMAHFETALAAEGLKCVQGARFWHILDARCGKDIAVNLITREYCTRLNQACITVGLGDGPNDAPLLDSVDYAVIVKGINRQGVTVKNTHPDRLYRTQLAGPAGWHEGLDHLFGGSCQHT